MNTIGLDTFALVTLLIMAVALPLVGIWDFRRLVRWVTEGRPDARRKTYQWIIVMEWTLVVGFVAWWLMAGRSWQALGLVPAAGGWQWLAIGLGLVGTGFVIWQMVTVMASPKELDKARGQMGDLAGLVPQNPAENRLFAVVSVTAGICEEILYRGVLLAVLIPAVGTWSAVFISSAIFGLGHAYQGAIGIGKTSLVGLVMALLAVFSGSLFVPMLLHAVIDLTSGRIMGAAMLEKSPTESPA